MKKNSPSKFCLDVSALSVQQKRQFASKISEAVDSFNESLEGENKSE